MANLPWKIKKEYFRDNGFPILFLCEKKNIDFFGYLAFKDNVSLEFSFVHACNWPSDDNGELHKMNMLFKDPYNGIFVIEQYEYKRGELKFVNETQYQLIDPHTGEMMRHNIAWIYFPDVDKLYDKYSPNY